MATTAYAPGFPASRMKTEGLTFPKRLVNAIVASRIEAAKAELRRHHFLVREAALTHGAYRRVGLDAADLLPFNT